MNAPVPIRKRFRLSRVESPRIALALSVLPTAFLLAVAWGHPGCATRSPERRVRVDRDVQYGTAAGEPLYLDVYRPDVVRIHPAVMLVHGGGWVGGDKSYEAWLGHALAREGYTAFAVDYRLAKPDRNKYPAQLDDVQRAVRWVRSNAANYQIDPARIGAMGESAGGHLVALLGTRDTRMNDDPALARFSSRVKCVVDLFGPTYFIGPNFRSLKPRDDSVLPEDLNGVSSQGRVFVLSLFGKTPQQAPALYGDASPLYWVNRRSAPFLIMHGTEDPLVPMEQSEKMAKALKAAGVEVQLIKMEHEGHGFRLPPNQRLMVSAALKFLQRHLHPER